MGVYKYIRELHKKPKANLKDVWRERLVQWRREPATLRVERPTRLDRARSLGYRAKEGIFVVRQRVKRGGRARPKPVGGRRSKRFGKKIDLMVSYKTEAERRANKKFVNCEVLNSYYAAKDGLYYWYEVIMVDKANPSILKDKQLSWTARPANRRRAFRGLTSAGRKSRGLRAKGKGAEKVRPGVRANNRRTN